MAPVACVLSQVLQHAFFDTQHGSMREHFVVDAIRAELPLPASMVRVHAP